MTDSDIETPELVDLQDEFSKTSTTVVNEIPQESEKVIPETTSSDEGLLTDGQKKLPEALKKHIISKKKEESEEDSEVTSEIDVKAAVPDDGETGDTEKSPDDSIFNNPVEQEPPTGEFHEPVVEQSPEAAIETPINTQNKYAEVYAAHAISQKVASMPLAEYEEWLFPPTGSPDHLRGQMCLARIEASLKAANGGRAIADLWQIKIGAALWSRLHYREGDLEATRKEAEKAPPMEMIPLIPKNASEAISVIEEMQATGIEKPDTQWGLIGACFAAVTLPLLLLRRG